MAARPLVVPPLFAGCDEQFRPGRRQPGIAQILRVIATRWLATTGVRPATYGRLLTLRTHVRTSASTSGSNSLTSCTVMPGLIRGS